MGSEIIFLGLPFPALHLAIAFYRLTPKGQRLSKFLAALSVVALSLIIVAKANSDHGIQLFVDYVVITYFVLVLPILLLVTLIKVIVRLARQKPAQLVVQSEVPEKLGHAG